MVTKAEKSVGISTQILHKNLKSKHLKEKLKLKLVWFWPDKDLNVEKIKRCKKHSDFFLEEKI